MKSVGQNFHRISRMNQRLACLSDYSRICADIWPLANGSRPICAAIVFGHADFADDADFYSWDYFCPTDFTDIHRFFFVGGVCPTDFTDIHRFFMESLVNRFVQSQGDICNDRTGRLREIPCRPMMKKICVICEICVTKKRPKKNLCISVKSVGQKNNITGPLCSYFVRPSSSNVLS